MQSRIFYLIINIFVYTFQFLSTGKYNSAIRFQGFSSSTRNVRLAFCCLISIGCLQKNGFKNEFLFNEKLPSRKLCLRGCCSGLVSKVVLRRLRARAEAIMVVSGMVG